MDYLDEEMRELIESYKLFDGETIENEDCEYSDINQTDFGNVEVENTAPPVKVNSAEVVPVPAQNYFQNTVIEPLVTQKPAVDPAKPPAEKKEKANARNEFLKIIDSLPTYRDNLDNLYYIVEDGKHKEMLPLGSELFLGYIQDRISNEKGVFLTPKEFYQSFSMVKYRASKIAIQECEIINRVRGDDAYLYIDMYTTPTSFLRFNKKTGEHDYIQHTPFARFRHDLARPLQKIQQSDGGALMNFFALHNVDDTLDQALITAVIIGVFHNDVTVPYLWILGDKGSGKSTLAKCIRDIFDPAGRPSHAPKSSDNLAQLLNHHFFPVLDNIGKISFEQSNLFCESSTGINYSVRALYTNDGDHVFSIKTSGIFTSIKTFNLEPDLLDRTFFLRRPPIENTYMGETKIEGLSSKMQPEVLFELLHIYKETLKYSYTENIITGARLTDFSGVLKLVCKTYFNDESLAYKVLERNNKYKSIEEEYRNPVVAAIVQFMKERQSWRGCISDLLTVIQEQGFATPDMPPTPNSFSRVMNRNIHELRKYNIDVKKLKKVASHQPYELFNIQFDGEPETVNTDLPERYIQ